MRIHASSIWMIALWFCFLLEVGAISFLRPVLGMYASPVLYMVAGVLNVFFLVKLKIGAANPGQVTRWKWTGRKRFLLIVIYATLVLLGWLWLRKLFPVYPIDPKQSDIIPLVQLMVKRFSNGVPVYQEVYDFGYYMYPNYLPFTWVSFLAAELLSLDYRTWAYIIMTSSLSVFLWIRTTGLGQPLGIFILPALVFLIFYYVQPTAFGRTVEMQVTGFYILLLAALYTRSAPVLVTALLLCLLSRYAIVLWVPFLFFLLWLEHRRNCLVVGTFLLTGIVFIMLPFLLQDPGLLRKGYDYYTSGTLAEWDGQSWQQAGDLPYQLSQGFGFAIYFYKWNSLQALESIKLFHLVICLLVPIFCFGWYYRKGRALLPLNWFLMLSLKIYLLFFFLFIQLPYSYLYFTPLMISACIMGLFVLETRQGV